ncbi:MAG: bifunctional (p)ppGpp synthetase/guanosine-3',5'-bis(diphosphate) 3'-pyrophosphohydrolase [Bacillota bacterium]|jgi:GTP pyrophosphokinase|nr:bifunctional (p)ppGpp synthetase/guanosine-3',5'-bis(diphosphate) 3'-pyrophosphohydrolase [Bacillota bacterium]HOJ57085.1 bifunctional (p)ppGpp synthetase/guanosine-3',5'-bis(diphosphate) 3'-pyrophosphohydrolase [Bacillota bacterium]HOL01611.1 bifunctional (p)ppGpp synthetase/guanosine-3',5'-bis(diphosphate) 3'-pyrophosphohydrolase [Bacillota bacterium]HPO79870.1 bifunctional (p)ppGpp synthetase/guanosine-3',5'-bis(diphosphate) 3'-pyrophosphohydrolase [Bacillota bacterium]
MGVTVEDLLDRIKQYAPSAPVDIVMQAYDFASRAHAGQRRDSGDWYIFHPLEVALILAELEMDVATIAAGLLHDVIEDTDATLSEVQATFGDEIGLLVDGVTKLGRVPLMSREEQQAENLRKMFLAMAQDIRVVLIKLADRLHNMRTLGHLPWTRQARIARETLEIYAPLAHRLGMWRIKWELEDLALRYLEPGEYYKLVDKVARKRKEREVIIEEAKAILKKNLDENNIPCELQGRAKHFYSIYEKMRIRGKTFDEIYDLIAVRIIVNTVRDCYAALGIVHSLWKPIPGRFKDYIAMPKSNMYQSLHTAVIGPRGEPLEIQIRTWEMHRTAEYGIAAHWRYKEGTQAINEFEEKLSWLRQLLEWQRDMKDVHDFMETLKIELFKDEVYVFTPKGDVKSLPAGSTPVDFAYSVHTDIGHRCIGSRVNGKMTPLDYQLANGDIVEIITSKGETGPSLDWLAFVKTSKARSKIRQWAREVRRSESVPRGRDLLEKELRRQGMEVHENLKEDKLQVAASRLGFQDPDDLLASVGDNRISAALVIGRLAPERPEKQKEEKDLPQLPQRRGRETAQGIIIVKGADNVLARMARCCNPVPGDEIVGYITRGKGISVHRRDCPNIAWLRTSPERCIDVEWVFGRENSYPVELEIEAIDRVALLTNIMNAVTGLSVNITAVNAHTDKDHMAVVNMLVEITSSDHLNSVIERVKRVKGVTAVRRAQQIGLQSGKSASV